MYIYIYICKITRGYFDVFCIRDSKGMFTDVLMGTWDSHGWISSFSARVTRSSSDHRTSVG